MMKLKPFAGAIAILAGLSGLLFGVQRISARQLPLQNPEQLRFQLIGDEQIAGPDGRSVVAGWSVLVFKDRRAQRCYVAFKQANSITSVDSLTCPPN
jgi:hypothetical protein